ncbi:MAG: hypothetical protein M3R36_16975 [Bacteroidota bacterium]|nr:hypothetical protein [Bacteroidota bacterium]
MEEDDFQKLLKNAEKIEKVNINTVEVHENSWSDFSLKNAMRGLEDDNMPKYSLDDLKEKWS